MKRKITKIHLIVFEGDGSHTKLVCAIQSTLSPFIYLMDGASPYQLSCALAGWISAGPGEYAISSNCVVHHLFMKPTGNIFKIEFGEGECVIRTTFSETRIHLCRFAGGHGVEVDFAGAGSTEQAMSILSASEFVGVRFNVYSYDDLITHKDVLKALVARARMNIRNIENFPTEDRSRVLLKSNGEIDSFKRALKEAVA